MRSLSLLVLLLFAVVARTAASSPPAIPTLMDELLANGGRQRLKSYNDLYLTDHRPAIYELNLWALPKQDYLQDWTIERMNDNEVVIKSNRPAGNFFIGHGTDDYAKEAKVANAGQPSAFLTPVKNSDGTWSFKSRENKWLSAHAYYQDYEPRRSYVNFQPENRWCEHWKLEPYTPPPPTPMSELMANGGKYQFKAFNDFYMTDEATDSKWIWTLPQRMFKQSQDWTIVQMNNNEVAIKSNYHGYWISHGTGSWAHQAAAPLDWEMLIPVKNADGSWSFQSRYHKWLSGHSAVDNKRNSFYVSFESNNWKCEKWKLEPY